MYRCAIVNDSPEDEVDTEEEVASQVVTMRPITPPRLPWMRKRHRLDPSSLPLRLHLPTEAEEEGGSMVALRRVVAVDDPLLV